MPISRKDFEKGLDTDAGKIVDFLDSRLDDAFTSLEIAQELGMEHGKVVEYLNYLYRKADAIDRTRIADTFYYASLKEKE